ncbi:6,7-dimethyl-8-ribityllumazine synthase [Spirochaeta cellobiosiphila]|uniref:6,7-dimethyl-8-ribityllumazine synthase n=1 Tax=Spirochaeta cellobiosiphila TaxID=504483 RepID=UPI0003F906DF|nr:6,7-dimethyl-8-ribityllumazine synthase [Spirochaeta cellobiosiphila]
MTEIIGQLNITEAKVAIVIGRFNSLITEQLLEGAIDGLTRHGLAKEDITLVRVPGAFEIPLMAQKLARTSSFDAILCLGAVIRGNTPHFDYVSAEVSKGISQVSLKENLPIIFGVLTTDNMEQALERAGVKSGNKGFDAALTTIEMINLGRSL